VVFLTLDAANELSADEVKAAIASVTAIARDPAPTVELRRVMSGKARYQISFWAPDHDAGVAAAVAAMRKHFPAGEVHAT
jgi:hypothetical protein